MQPPPSPRSLEIHHRPDDHCVVWIGALELAVFFDPFAAGASRALWFLRGRGALLAEQPVGAA